MNNLADSQDLDTLIGNSGNPHLDGTTTGGIIVDIVEEVRALGNRGFHVRGNDTFTEGELMKAAAAHVTASFAAGEDREQRRDTMLDAIEAFPFHGAFFDHVVETESGDYVIDPAKSIMRGIAYLIAEVQRIRRAEAKAIAAAPINLEDAA